MDHVGFVPESTVNFTPRFLRCSWMVAVTENETLPHEINPYEVGH